MEFFIAEEVKQRIPHFKIGLIEYDHIQVSESPQMLKGRLRFFQESIFFDLENKNAAELDGIREWREVFKRVGTDPNRYRPSNEALFRRVQKQQYLQSIHSAVDLNNFFSLKYEIPLGIYDRNKIKGPITLKIGKNGDSYDAINGRQVNLENKLVTCDANGPFGSPYVDSKRTAVQLSTTSALHIVYLKPSMRTEEAKKLLGAMANMFVQIHGGDARQQIFA